MCIYFEECAATICPLDESSMQNAAWFPDEEVCRKNGYAWVSRQKRIAKKCTFDSGCFTYKMLQRNFRINAGTKGLNPDRDFPYSESEVKWLENHPELAPISDERKQALSARVADMRSHRIQPV